MPILVLTTTILLLTEGIISPNLHYGPYARDWWVPRWLENDNTIPYRLYMCVSSVLNQRQFIITVVQNEENLLQPGFVCTSGSETSKIFPTSSQAINNVYHNIFGKKTAYSGPAALDWKKYSSCIENWTSGTDGFISSVLTKKGQRTLALQQINGNTFILDFYKGKDILWHYKDQSANSVWNKVGITTHIDGTILFGYEHPLVQHIILDSQMLPDLTCTSSEWTNSYKMECIFKTTNWKTQNSNKSIEFHHALAMIYPPIYKISEKEFRAWRAMLRACGCTNITPYPRNNNEKEFWNCAYVYIIDHTLEPIAKDVEIQQNAPAVIEPVINIDYPWNEGWALRENAVFGNRGGGKRMSDAVKQMLERMFLLGNIHAEDRMTAKEMNNRLKEFADNGELEPDEVPKISTIQGWTSRYNKLFLAQATRTALQSNSSESSSMVVGVKMSNVKVSQSDKSSLLHVSGLEKVNFTVKTNKFTFKIVSLILTFGTTNAISRQIKLLLEK
ncbi:hypothetical protein G9A89_022987 [Geosiphon pyriformis]|nr:hypothetical protein G9A89_022987 [Geosiphon pyriformis]